MKQTFEDVHVGATVEKVVVAVFGRLMGDSDRAVRTLELWWQCDLLPIFPGLYMDLLWSADTAATRSSRYVVGVEEVGEDGDRFIERVEHFQPDSTLQKNTFLSH